MIQAGESSSLTESRQKIIDDYYNDYREQYEFQTIWTNVSSENDIKLFIYLKQKSCETFPGLMIELIKPSIEISTEFNVPIDLQKTEAW